MTTQTRKPLSARKAAYKQALVEFAYGISPRPSFLVEPIVKERVGEDPEGEVPPHEVWYFVVNGSKEELGQFHRRLTRKATEPTRGDDKLFWAVLVTAVLATEIPVWLSTPVAS
jgi:hypothetical protein